MVYVRLTRALRPDDDHHGDNGDDDNNNNNKNNKLLKECEEHHMEEISVTRAQITKSRPTKRPNKDIPSGRQFHKPTVLLLG